MLPSSFTPALLGQLELLKIRSRRAFLGARQGIHVSKKRGFGIEFSDYRKYELGDNPRDIDWNVYARSDRLYVKRFQEDQDLSILIILDTSASMITPGEDKKWNRAVEIALALSYIALMQQDSVTICALGSFLSPSSYGARAIHILSEQLTGLEVGQPFEFSREILRALSRIKYPGICIFISDFLLPIEELPGIFNPMRAMNLDIVALHLLGAHDIKPFRAGDKAVAIDSESGEETPVDYTADTARRYNELLENHILGIKDYLASSGVGYLPARADSELSDFLLTQLPRTGLVE